MYSRCGTRSTSRRPGLEGEVRRRPRRTAASAAARARAPRRLRAAGAPVAGDGVDGHRGAPRLLGGRHPCSDLAGKEPSPWTDVNATRISGAGSFTRRSRGVSRLLPLGDARWSGAPRCRDGRAPSWSVRRPGLSPSCHAWTPRRPTAAAARGHAFRIAGAMHSPLLRRGDRARAPVREPRRPRCAVPGRRGEPAPGLAGALLADLAETSASCARPQRRDSRRYVPPSSAANARDGVHGDAAIRARGARAPADRPPVDHSHELPNPR